MKQNVNYIAHHKAVNVKMMEDDLSPIHISLYNALFLIWNECGFDTELSINRTDMMNLSKIGSANTYSSALKHLHDKGYINYKPSHNPLIGSRVNLHRFDTSSDTSSDTTLKSYLYKSDTTSAQVVIQPLHNSCTSSDITPDTLYKLLNSETIKLLNNHYELINDCLEVWIKNHLEGEEQDDSVQYVSTEHIMSFEEFWILYDKKIDREKCFAKFKKLSAKDIEAIKKHLPVYVKNTPERQYRKNPLTYLSQKTYLDDIEDIKSLNTTKKSIEISTNAKDYGGFGPN